MVRRRLANKIVRNVEARLNVDIQLVLQICTKHPYKSSDVENRLKAQDINEEGSTYML